MHRRRPRPRSGPRPCVPASCAAKHRDRLRGVFPATEGPPQLPDDLCEGGVSSGSLPGDEPELPGAGLALGFAQVRRCPSPPRQLKEPIERSSPPTSSSLEVSVHSGPRRLQDSFSGLRPTWSPSSGSKGTQTLPGWLIVRPEPQTPRLGLCPCMHAWGTAGSMRLIASSAPGTLQGKPTCGRQRQTPNRSSMRSMLRSA